MVKGLTWTKAHHKGFKTLLKLERLVSMRLFIVMMIEMTRDGLVIASQQRLARMVGASDRAVRDALDELVANGAIKQEGQGRYRISPWFASYGQHKNADDGQTVVVGKGFYVVNKKTGEIVGNH